MTYDDFARLSDEGPIIFYDGVCKLCHGFVSLVISHDRCGRIRFCGLQEEKAQVIRDLYCKSQEIDTVIGLYKSVVYTHSDVLFLVARTLGGIWLLLIPLSYLPRRLRNRVYTWLAGNRYRWFGKYDDCQIPDPIIASRFIC